VTARNLAQAEVASHVPTARDPLRLQPSVPTRLGGADVARALALALLIFAVYFGSFARSLPSTSDEMIDFGLIQSFARWQAAAIDQISTVGPKPEQFGAGGHRYSKFGPLQAILASPLFLAAQRLPVGIVDFVLLLNLIVSAVALALLFLLARAVGYSGGVAVGVTALAALGTPIWVHAKHFYAEPTILLCITATALGAYLAATSNRPIWYLLAGIAFGAGIAAKYVDAALLWPVPIYLAWCASRERGQWVRSRFPAAFRRMACFGLGSIPIIALCLLYNLARFGSPLVSGYAHDETFSTPTWLGVAGFLVSPGKSIFVYTPTFLLLLVWGWRFARRQPAFTALLGAIIVLHLVVMGSWVAWWGAWTWGPRFLVPIMPLLALGLAEGFASARGLGARVAIAGLSVASLAVQLLGIAVDHDVYIVQLLPLDPLPDTLTIWNVQYNPIVHQIGFLTRQWLDFSWVQRTGPTVIDWPALGLALGAVVFAALVCGLVWRSRSWSWSLLLLGVGLLVVAASTVADLRRYERADDPMVVALARRVSQAPASAGLIQLLPSAIVTYDNWQKSDDPELGWIEEPQPAPLILSRIDELSRTSSEIWVSTDAPAKSPSNGIEAHLDRALVPLSAEPFGQLRLLRYATATEPQAFAPVGQPFADGIELVGFRAGGNAGPGTLLQVTLEWRAAPEPTTRPDLTVFVHLLDSDGRLAAQEDDPPAAGYLPTSSWRPGQVVYDLHAIPIPSTATGPFPTLEIGLYRPTTGERLAVVGPAGTPSGDAVRAPVR
jgi:hypothetical protein